MVPLGGVCPERRRTDRKAGLAVWAPPQETRPARPAHTRRGGPARAELGAEGDRAMVTPVEWTPALTPAPHVTHISPGSPDFSASLWTPGSLFTLKDPQAQPARPPRASHSPGLAVPVPCPPGAPSQGGAFLHWCTRPVSVTAFFPRPQLSPVRHASCWGPGGTGASQAAAGGVPPGGSRAGTVARTRQERKAPRGPDTPGT